MMKPIYWVVLVAIILVSLYLSRNQIKSVLTRAYKNNNPGNIRPTVPADNAWVGEVRPSTDPAFRQFISMPYGYRAIFVNLKGYFAHGLNTIRKIISTWAPSSDNNNTAAYIANVAKLTGKGADDVLTFSDVATIKKIAAAISKQESGVDPDLNDLDQGYTLLTA